MCSTPTVFNTHLYFEGFPAQPFDKLYFVVRGWTPFYAVYVPSQRGYRSPAFIGKYVREICVLCSSSQLFKNSRFDHHFEHKCFKIHEIHNLPSWRLTLADSFASRHCRVKQNRVLQLEQAPCLITLLFIIGRDVLGDSVTV